MADQKAFHKPLFEQIPEEKRLAVLDAAEAEFAELGFSEATIGRIAERARVSVGSLYKYFENKEELYLSVVRRGFDLLDKALAPILSSELDFAGKIGAIVDAIFEYADTRRPLMLLYNRFTTEGNAELAGRIAESIESYTAVRYARLIADARADGALTAPADDRMLAFCLDNIFLTLQFSLSGEYYRDRMRIYLGSELAGDRARLREGIIAFISQALGIAGRA